MENRKSIGLLCLRMLCVAMFCHFASSLEAVAKEDVERVLDRLDREIRRVDAYKQLREEGIDSVKQVRRGLRRGDGGWFDCTMDIAGRYSSFNNDSAIFYYGEGLLTAREGGMDSLVTEFRVRRATCLSIGGYIHDAIQEVALVDTTRFGAGLWRTYRDATRQMYSYISSYYDEGVPGRDRWRNLSVDAQKRLLPLLDKGSVDYRLNLGEYYYSCREYSRSRQVLSSLVGEISSDTREYAVASHILAEIARVSGNRNDYIYHLANSAIADIRRAALEVTSIQELGGSLFEAGETKRAHNYLITAMDNAVGSRASVRIGQTSELLTMVEHDHGRQIAAWRRVTNVAILVLVVCLVALVVTMWYLRRQLRRVDRMKSVLEEANKTKDVYISQFLALSSIYMDKLQQFSKLVNRKLSAGQVDELQKLTKSGKFIEEQSKEFYSVFDDAFLHIYPAFVEKVNELLRPEHRIAPPDGELLNSDLRILAFMRLGIDDAQRVEQILNYSVNTIYAYRNKLRNKAISRDTFEADIMAIG